MEFCDLKAQYAALEGEILARIKRVLEHGRCIMGPEVAELEAALAARVGVRHAITVASGSEALLIALMALELEAGDEVVTTPFTFAATAEAIVRAGGVPVFVDIEADTALIDAGAIDAAITPRTRVLMPVSLYGQCADMPAIERIAKRHGLAVVEDAAQSFGARLGGHSSVDGSEAFDGRASGSFGAFGATSFFPSKPLGCYGDGGALFTDDDDLAQAAREIRVHGQRERCRHVRIGVGGRMDTLQCAVLLAKLPRFDWELARRREIASRYSEAFAASHGLRPTVLRAGRTTVHAQYTLRVDEGRDALAAALHAQGIPTAIHYPMPLHRQDAYARWAPADACPNATRLSREVLSLPMSADLDTADQARVIDTVRGWAASR